LKHDSDQVHQVLLNLLLNAVQAMEGAGTVHVEIGSRDDCASVVVSDTGRGISPQNLPNIFRPFFTTKGGGTGLGLSLAYRIVEDHHGRIEVSSAVGKGKHIHRAFAISHARRSDRGLLVRSGTPSNSSLQHYRSHS